MKHKKKNVTLKEKQTKNKYEQDNGVQVTLHSIDNE